MLNSQTKMIKLSKWKRIKIFDDGDVETIELNDHEKFMKKFPKTKPRKLIKEISKMKSDMCLSQTKALQLNSTNNESNSANLQSVTNFVNESYIENKTAFVDHTFNNAPTSYSLSNVFNVDSNNIDSSASNEPNCLVCESSQDLLNQDKYEFIFEDFTSNQDNDYFIIHDFSSMDDVNNLF